MGIRCMCPQSPPRPTSALNSNPDRRPDAPRPPSHTQVAFIGGVADSNGYGWAIAKALAEAGATIAVGTWPPVLGIFKVRWRVRSIDGGRVCLSVWGVCDGHRGT